MRQMDGFRLVSDALMVELDVCYVRSECSHNIIILVLP